MHFADLTDKKPNVFYELGVRHTLRHRTILIAQSRDDIPSDLDGYASHEYDWNTEPGQAEFKANIRDSLQQIEEDPNRSDNPVSDFLQERSFRIFEFQREENVRKLRALSIELGLVHTELEDAAGDEKKRVYKGPYLQPYPAMDHLVATQYILNDSFCFQVFTLRQLLEVMKGSTLSQDASTSVLPGVEIVKANADRILAAYEAGDSTEGVELKPWRLGSG